ncbi:MAG: thiamine pyrophosphate-dependent enzyme, partial [Pseudomonadota bacterium]|nr:thiamine pyrophosphate-dependent enzyme [Pseudomonadota bacterium]
QIPVAETIAGKGAFTHEDPVHIGSIGVVGSTSANYAAERADLVIAVGTRLQDFTTGSWTAFDHRAQFITINAARWDAQKHQSLAVVGDAKVCLEELSGYLKDFKLDGKWLSSTKTEFSKWNKLLDELQAPTNAPIPTYAQVVGMVNKSAKPDSMMVTAAGGLPGEVSKGWRVKEPNTFDCEFGFSCMGYEIAGGWGVAMATSGRSTPIVMVGDGSYLMMNSDIYSSVLTGHKMIIIVCDNGGFAVINRLQNFKGGRSFNNLIQDCKVKKPFAVDFAQHAESMGALVKHCENLSDLENALEWANGTDRTTVISIVTDAYSWVPGDADWDVGVPEISDRSEVIEARKHQDQIRSKQRMGV